MSKEILFSTHVREDEISLCLTKTYVNSITDFFEFQRQWFYRSYSAFKDLDKYLILVYLFQKTFHTYNQYFIKKTFNEFYAMGSFEIGKFNIIEVSKDLMITKETARRKILELENDGVIQKDKKIIRLNQKSINVQKPEESVLALSRFASTFSKVLIKYKFLKNDVSTLDFGNLIKNNFTQCWSFFLEFQIPYCLKMKRLFGDLEIFLILGMVIYNQNLYLRKNSPDELEKDYFKKKYTQELIKLGDKNGINAMTISDLTGIPRPTILRKLNKILEKKTIVRDKNNLYNLTSDFQKIKDLDSIRIDTVKNWSTFMAKLYNFIKL